MIHHPNFNSIIIKISTIKKNCIRISKFNKYSKDKLSQKIILIIIFKFNTKLKKNNIIKYVSYVKNYCTIIFIYPVLNVNINTMHFVHFFKAILFKPFKINLQKIKFIFS